MTARLHAFLRLCRVRDWMHFLPLPLATFDSTAPLSGGLWAAGRGVASACTILAFGYLINSVADRHMDLDARKNPLIQSDAGEHRWALAALLAGTLLLCWLAPWPAGLAGLLCTAILYVYSAGPRLKAVPLVGSLMNVGNFTPLLFVGMRTTDLPAHMGSVTVAFAALLLQNQFIHEGADQTEDRGGQLRTTWLTFGPYWTAAFAAAAGFAATVAAARLAPLWAGRVFLFGGLLVFVAAFPLCLMWLRDDWRRIARLRIAHRLAAAVFGIALFLSWRGL